MGVWVVLLFQEKSYNTHGITLVTPHGASKQPASHIHKRRRHAPGKDSRIATTRHRPSARGRSVARGSFPYRFRGLIHAATPPIAARSMSQVPRVGLRDDCGRCLLSARCWSEMLESSCCFRSSDHRCRHDRFPLRSMVEVTFANRSCRKPT